MLVSMSRVLQQKGSSAIMATKQSYGILYGQVIRQATTQSFLDIFFLLAIAMFCLIPFAMMLKKNDPHKGPSMGD